MGRTVQQHDQRSDAELIAATRSGDRDAYGVLYERHHRSALSAAAALGQRRSDAADVVADAFARVLAAIQAGGGPQVAFRPYLLTAVRNAVYDRTRRRREDLLGDAPEVPADAGPLDPDRRADADLVARAYASLPERWQMVLWHTEVEGLPASEVAPMLGIAPNAVAALAYRAREGLRQAYLQAHLRVQDDAQCRRCAEQLGAYVRDGVSTRDREWVEQHLAGCSSCQALLAELRDTNTTLRTALVPVVVGVPVGAYAAGLTGGGLLARLTSMSPRAGVVTAGCAACVCGAAVVGVIALDDEDVDLRVVAEAPATVARGDAVRVTLAVTAADDATYPQVVVAIVLPAATSVESDPSGVCDTTGTCTLGPVAAGSSVQASIDVRTSTDTPATIRFSPSVLQPADTDAATTPATVSVVDPADASPSRLGSGP